MSSLLQEELDVWEEINPPPIGHKVLRGVNVGGSHSRVLEGSEPLFRPLIGAPIRVTANEVMQLVRMEIGDGNESTRIVERAHRGGAYLQILPRETGQAIAAKLGHPGKRLRLSAERAGGEGAILLRVVRVLPWKGR